jgi:lipid-A-disaccharide synthase
MAKQLLRLMISAGELSADEHAAALIARLKLLCELSVCGMGGRHLKTQGADISIDSEKTAGLMGFSSVLKSLRKVRSSLLHMQALLRDFKPDVLVVVDYPDFNLRLCATAHKLGIPVLYFIPPKVWAWRSGRVAKLARYCSTLACIFPFEREFYSRYGLRDRAIYVGHPFSTTLSELELNAQDKMARIQALGLAATQPVLAFFPGSRAQELERHSADMRQVLELVRQRLPLTQALIPIPPALLESEALKPLRAQAQTKLIAGDPLVVLQCASAALMKSGTSNLQAAFLGAPFAMYYHSSAFETWLVRNFVRIKEYSPVNIIRPQTVVELVGDRATPELAAQEMLRILGEPEYRSQIISRLSEVRAALGDHDTNPIFEGSVDAYDRVARLVVALGERSRGARNEG